MAPAKPSRSGSRSSAAKKKKSTGATRSYTILRKSTIDPKRKVSSQGKSATTTKTGAHLAARVALKRRTRPSRIYLYRKKKIITYSIRYTKNKDGKTKAVAKLMRSVLAKRKKTSSKKKTTKAKKKTTSRETEIALLNRKLVRLTNSAPRRRFKK